MLKNFGTVAAIITIIYLMGFMAAIELTHISYACSYMHALENVIGSFGSAWLSLLLPYGIAAACVVFYHTEIKRK